MKPFETFLRRAAEKAGFVLTDDWKKGGMIVWQPVIERAIIAFLGEVYREIEDLKLTIDKLQISNNKNQDD